MYIVLYWTETELSKFYLRLVNILWYADVVAAAIAAVIVEMVVHRMQKISSWLVG